jgi:hypothetical protein
MERSTERVFADLVQWITRSSDGGVVHESLELKGDGDGNGNGTARGVFAKKAISKGETLVALPANLAVSGSQLPNSYGDGDRDRRVSNWLRCIAAYYEARQKGHHFQPYLNSLPSAYDSLLEWSDDEVTDLLAGTALCSLVLKDRKDKVLETRFQEAVRPYLKHVGLIPSSESMTEEMTAFREACMCVSTRGFHLQEAVSSSLYSGPFLLPFIDLLNHDPSRKCTTLQYAKNRFYMEAERDVAAGEEICHSYAANLTSAEVLKTFGFIPDSSIGAAERGVAVGDHVTPAIISKSEMLSACQSVAKSSFPSTVRSYMESSKMLEEEESWDLAFDFSNRDLSFLPDDFIVPSQNPLSDELVTVCSILFLPSDVHSEFIKGGATLLERNMLDDYYLGKIVCKAIQVAVTEKLATYSPVKIPEVEAAKTEDDKMLLREIRHTPDLQRAVFALTIRLEEKSCLAALRSDIFYISDALGGIPLSTKDVGTAISQHVPDKSDRGEPEEKKAKHVQ